MKINFKYLVPIMVLACFNIAILNELFVSDDYSNNSISNSIFPKEQLAKANQNDSNKTNSLQRDSLINVEIKLN